MWELTRASGARRPGEEDLVDDVPVFFFGLLVRDAFFEAALLGFVDAVPFARRQDFAYAGADVRVAVGFGVEWEGAGGAVGWDAVPACEVLPVSSKSARRSHTNMLKVDRV
jgi:hypothetical protein